MDDPISSSPFSPEQIKRRKLDGEPIVSPSEQTITEEVSQSTSTITIAPTKIQSMIKGQNQNMDSSNTDSNKTRDSLVEIEDDEDENEMMVMDDIGDEESMFNNNNSLHQHDSSKRFIQPDGQAQTLDDLMKSISSERVTRKDFMSSAVIDPMSNRIQLVTVSNNNKMNPKSAFGYDVERKTYLCPEEALYLMETGKLEICIENIPISIIKARALFISEKLGLSQPLPSPSEFDAVTCTDEEYTVFKLLSAHGYRLRRCFIPPLDSLSLNQKKGQVVDVIELEQEEDEDVEMKSGNGTEIEDNIGASTTTTTTSTTESTKNDEKMQDFHSVFGRSQLKRKIPIINPSPSSLTVSLDDDDATPIDWELPSTTSSSKIGGAKKINIISEEEKMIDDDDDDDSNRIYVELEVPGPSSSCSTSTRVFNVRGEDDSSFSSSIEEDEPMPSTSKGLRDNEEPYTVVEVDSDVEFIDEVIFSSSQVEIEEVGSFKYEGDDPTMDLPDIEEDDEEESEGEGYYEEDDEEEEDYNNAILQGDIIRHSSTSTCNKNSRGGVQLVDLVSSDEGEDEEDRTQIIKEDVAVKNFAETIWSKFVPNSVVHLKFPPASLLPKEIQRNVDSKAQINKEGGTTVSSSSLTLGGGGETQENQIPVTYEFDMKDQGDQSDLELEKIVDELKIDSEPMDSSSEPTTATNDNVNLISNDITKSRKSTVKNWKEWRQQFVKEAHDVFNSSLLGGVNSKGVGNQVMEKLNLWTNNKTFINHSKTKDTNSPELDFTYYLYNPTDKKVHKAKLEVEVKPAYRIFISRNIELVRDLKTLKGKEKDDDIPMLIALVQEDSGVTFLLPDLTPIHSLC